MRLQMRSFAYRVPVALLLLCVVAGCGPTKTKIQGKVTYKGKPVVFGSISLIASDGTNYSAEIKPDGSFALDGVPTGMAKIGVSSPDPHLLAGPKTGGKDVGFERGDRRAAPPPDAVIQAWFALPDKYADPINSGVSKTVSKGEDLL